MGFLASCKKEVQIDLQSKESRVVIEADFSAEKRVNTVYLSKTSGVYSDAGFPGLRDAYVVVTDHETYTEVLTESEPGVYTTRFFKGKAGTTYFLKVVYENKAYEASSTLPSLVRLDTAYAVSSDFGNMKMYGFIPVYVDPSGVKNNYRFLQFVNGQRIKGSKLKNDQFSDGMPQQEPLFSMDMVLKPGDSYEIEMQMIDDANYRYFSSKEKTVNLESAAPANPVSNIRGGALGYFNVHSTQWAKIRVAT